MNQIITIGREFGSGGMDIGKRAAERLGIKCYDKELLSLAAKESGMCTEVFETHDEKPVNSFFYSLVADSGSAGRGFTNFIEMPLNQKVFLAQFETIQSIAKKESCIIVGRCADYALETYPGVLKVFICADIDDKIRRIAERYSLSKDKAMELMTKTDKKRANYYNYYSNKRWGVASTYDLCLNSSVLGEEGCVEIIIRALDLKHVEST